VQKEFENSLSLEGEKCAKCAKELRTCRSPEEREVIHRPGRQVETDPRVRGFRLRKNCKGINSNFVKDEVWGDSGPLDQEDVWRRSMDFGGRILGENSRRGYPKSQEPKQS
jgi:hypothetical protein